MIASDIHYQTKVDSELFKLIPEYARRSKPDFIVMPGDQIETIDFVDDEENKDFFESIIKDLSDICPVIIIPGNHEIRDSNSKNFRDRTKSDKNVLNTKALSYFDSLNNIDNVYFLNNSQVTINGITFLGFSPRFNTYQKNDTKTQNDFVEDYLNCNFKISQKKI